MKDDKKQFGGILVLLSLTLPVILMIASGAYMLFSYTVANEQIEAGAKLVLLAFAEEYFSAGCDGLEGRPGQLESQRDACHVYKMSKAVTRANEVRNLHLKALGNITITFSGSGSRAGDEGDALIEPFRYQAEEPAEGSTNRDQIISECTSINIDSDPFPCLIPRKISENDELANAFTFQGTVTQNHMINSLSNLFGVNLVNKSKNFFVKARAVPMRMCALIDMSRSSSYTTHPRGASPLVLPSYPLDEDGEILQLFNGEPYTGYYNSWNLLENERDESPTTQPIKFFKDDYGFVRPFPDNQAGYDEYEEKYPEFSKNHPDPATSTVVDTEGGIEEGSRSDSWSGDPSFGGSYSGTSDQPAYLVDLYRYESNDASTVSYKGPEPWLSILKGVHASFQVFRDRAVAGDKACMIFYNDRLTWKSIINLTDDFDYIQKVLDPSQFTNEADLLDHYSEASRWDGSIPNAPGNWLRTIRCGEAPDYGLNDPNCMPLWARLGLFPISGTFTNSVLAIAESMRQFEEDTLNTPSTDLVVHFGDGLTSCFQDDAGANCNSGRHQHYLRSMKQIERIVNRGMKSNNISFHNFLVGDHVQPHTLNISDGNGGCLTDAEARKTNPDTGEDPLQFVVDQGFNFWEMEHETKASNDAFNMYYYPPDDWTAAQKAAWQPKPFFQVNADWYNLVRMTGGIWAPLRPVDPLGCDPNTPPNCTLTERDARDLDSNNFGELGPHMQIYDPKCREIDEQVQDYLTDALKSASSFTIIK